MEVDVTPGSETGSAAGIILLHRDESSYFAATIDHEQLKLVRCTAAFGVSQAAVADSAKLTGAAGTFHLTASVVRGHITVSAVNDAPPGGAPVSVETFDSGLLRGRAGLTAAGGAARFEHFKVSFIHESEPLITTNAVFEDESLMNAWSNAANEWRPSANLYMVDGKPANLMWHRSQFPGDVELTVEPREFSDPNHEIGLLLAKSVRARTTVTSCATAVAKRATASATRLPWKLIVTARKPPRSSFPTITGRWKRFRSAAAENTSSRWPTAGRCCRIATNIRSAAARLPTTQKA